MAFETTQLVVFDEATLRPLTILPMRCGTAELIERRYFRLQVPRSLDASISTHSTVLCEEIIDIVTLQIEPLHRRGGGMPDRQGVIAFTEQRALACLLSPCFAPGQRPVVEDLMAQGDRLAEMLMELL